MKYRTQIITDSLSWSKMSVVHWCHTWEYKLFQETLNRVVDCVCIYDDKDNLTGYFTIVTYKVFKSKTICYLPYGPVFLINDTSEILKFMTSFLSQYGKEKNAIYVRSEISNAYGTMSRTPLFAYRTSFHQPRGEAIMDLSNIDIDTLGNQLSKSTKRNIKKATRNDLETTISSGVDILDHINAFIAINDTNTKQHNTTTHNRSYFENLFQSLSANSHNFVVVISHNNVPAAINVYTVFNNNAYCPFGASTNTGKKLGAYYWIKWQAIQYMIQNNIQQFNWGGIAIGKNDDNLAGLNSFKLGWGTKEKHHNDFYDVILSPLYWAYLSYSFFKQLRN